MTQDATALAACPFCGGKAATFFHRDRGMGDSWHVECQAEPCGCGTCHHETEAEAIAAWNTRTNAAQDRMRSALEGIANGIETPLDMKACARAALSPPTAAAQGECPHCDYPDITDEQWEAVKRLAARPNGPLTPIYPEQPTTDATEADMRAFCASDMACYRYPGADQAAERAAFCEGAALAQPKPAEDVELLREAREALDGDCTCDFMYSCQYCATKDEVRARIDAKLGEKP